jgi:hypothetical protein
MQVKGMRSALLQSAFQNGRRQSPLIKETEFLLMGMDVLWKFCQDDGGPVVKRIVRGRC